MKYFLGLALAVGLLVSCNIIDETAQHPPAVFAVNVSSLPMDFALGEDPSKPVFVVENLGVGQAKALSYLAAIGQHKLFYKNHKDSEWTLWIGDDGQAFSVDFRLGKTYSLIARSGGRAAIQILGEQYNSNPKVSIINNTGFKVLQVQFAEDLNQNVKLYSQELEPGKQTLFFSPKAGVYRVFWQMDGVPEFSGFLELADHKGTPVKATLKNVRDYLLILNYDRLNRRVTTDLLDITRSN